MADKISEKLALEVWELGVPLSDAPDAFGATKALARIRRQARLAARANTEMGKANFRKAGANADAILDALEPAIATLNASAGTRIAKEDRLFERLRTGELIALGFPVHDADTATPVQVPIFMSTAGSPNGKIKRLWDWIGTTLMCRYAPKRLHP